MDEIGIIPFHQYSEIDNFGLIDFMEESNFDHFIDLVRGENEIMNHDNFSFSSQDYNHDQFDQPSIGGGGGGGGGGVVCNINDLFPAAPPVEYLFDFQHGGGGNSSSYHDFGLQNAACRQKQAADHDQGQIREEEEEEDESSANAAATTTMTSTTPTKKNGGGKADRSRTLVSEQTRRCRMKDTLYTLRSLVPNITKMDKASIVGDAISYVQNLQMQAKKLQSEIFGLESSLKGRLDKHHREVAPNNMNKVTTSFYPIITKKIFKMDVYQVEERGFYVKIVSNKEKGVAASIYKALESLTSFNVRSSNLASSGENYVLTFTLHIADGEMDIDLRNMKLWIASVFLNQGFEFFQT
ncbi:hypothetical protein ABFX02_04G201000 [Erythranthe guttata]